MARRNQHSREELQALAIEAVRELVTEQGLEKLSVRKVAQRIGYTPGMLYHVFSNLDDLILQANARTLDELLGTMTYAADQPPRQALLAMAGAYLALARQHTALWKMVFMHRMNQQAPVPDWYLQRTRQLFARVEQQVARLGGDHDETQIHLAARTLWSSVHGMGVLAVEDKLTVAGEVDEQAMLASLFHHYLQSWAGEKTA
ncbi:TetR family transcriptional regulator [Alcanivorax hongdengensis A-11-3]|uniref:TetR family transcriptional regulator n=1 Tax=Alcanivorax hongdengensis A-11-3 TaxID=1177179 RepID=L0W9L8_9GAMM|nr:TetR/AcrR family transcriptional regulator [Alcanivorax hongdengensis]EKF73656.1 TetR family transcriptional regulator [Alcanivorax hongdengensis A-11-3]